MRGALALTDVELRLERGRELDAHFRRDLRVGQYGHAEHEPLDGLRKAEPLPMEDDVAILHVIDSGHATTRPTGVRRDMLTS